MNLQKFNTKDFFLNLGAIVALYVVIGSLLSLLFEVINVAYPKITEGYYYGYNSISWPVASIMVVFPIFILLMRVLENAYKAEPESRHTGIHKFLSYLTLFIAGGILIGNLVTVLYYFLDGQELTTGFLLKVLVLFVISGSIFKYYLSDIQNKLTSKSRMVWRGIALFIIVGSILWGFAVLGSPSTQRMYKYDNQKINDLSNTTGSINNYYADNGKLPESLDELGKIEYYYVIRTDSQTNVPYEYKKITDVQYEVCAVFNKPSNNHFNPSDARMYGVVSWEHTEGRNCFVQTVNPNMYSKPIPVR